jgi:hypothetical protein
MKVLLTILGIGGGLLLMILRALAVDQVRGQVQRRLTAKLEAIIASLPDELQAEWADEWRAELAAVISMPLTAARMVRGLRHSASALVGRPKLAPANANVATSQPGRSALPRRVSTVLAAVTLPKISIFGVMPSSLLRPRVLLPTVCLAITVLVPSLALPAAVVGILSVIVLVLPPVLLIAFCLATTFLVPGLAVQAAVVGILSVIVLVFNELPPRRP